jgi:mediator of RNA polymerase II transcription subunit 14
MLEFPREPTGIMKRHITDEADARLAFYLPLPVDEVSSPGVENPPRPQLPDGVVDTPLVRVFNFLRTVACRHGLSPY